MTVAQAKPSGRNVYLDLFKFFLCYMVICIHLVQTEYPIYPLYRLSVHMFFLISGYFLYTPDPDKAKGRAPGFIRRCATYMAVGIAIHTVYEVIAYLVDGTSVGWLLTTLFYDDPSLFWFRFFFENLDGCLSFNVFMDLKDAVTVLITLADIWEGRENCSRQDL